MGNFSVVRYFNRVVRDLPIRRKLILSFLILIILPVMLIGLFSFQRSSMMLKSKTEQYTKDIQMETGKNIEVRLQEAERLSFQVVSSTEIQNALNASNKGFEDEYERITIEKMIDSQLKGFLSSNLDVAAVRIVSRSGIAYYVNPGSIPFYNSDSDQRILEEGNGSTFWFDTNPAIQTIAVGRAINSLVNQNRIGFVYVYLRESSIFNVYKTTELFKNGDFFIASTDGTIISHKDKSLLGKKVEVLYNSQLFGQSNKNFLTSKINGKNYYISRRQIQRTDWQIVSLIPAVEYERDILWLRNWTILICVLCCVLALGISIAISDSISKPVRKLSAMMIKVGNGDFNVTANYEAKNEMGILNSHFNKMVAQVQQLIQEVYQQQLLKQKAELKSLRMQINPHFLYNTLESINWMARIKGIPEIGKMVKALGDLMRASISGDDYIMIEEEIKNIDNYLTIQKFRYGERFEVSIDICPEIQTIKIPKLILQPIVENAIVHGLENKIGNGRMEIKGRMEDGKAIIEVLDDGIGIEEETASNLLSDNNRVHQTEGHTRIGLKNVDRRIKMVYGQEYGIFIESSPGVGTSVTVSFPMDFCINEA